MTDLMDGGSRETGHRIEHTHCPGCGHSVTGPTSRLTDWGMREIIPTSCCGRIACAGYVTSTVWTGEETGREVWACCEFVAARELGEPVVNLALQAAADAVIRGMSS